MKCANKVHPLDELQSAGAKLMITPCLYCANNDLKRQFSGSEVPMGKDVCPATRDTFRKFRTITDWLVSEENLRSSWVRQKIEIKPGLQ